MLVAAWLAGCAADAPTGTGTVAPPPIEQGHPGIQIGQTGTQYDCFVDPLADPAVPADGVPYAATAWWAALPLELDATFGPVDHGIAELDGVPVAVTIAGAGSFGITSGDCGVAYVADATVSFRADDVLTVAFDVAVTATGPTSAGWTATAPAEDVGGALADPALGTLEPFPRVLRSQAGVDAAGASGELTWIVDDGDPEAEWWVPVAGWSAGARGGAR